MMVKAKLRKLRTLKATPKMVDIAANNEISVSGKNVYGYNTKLKHKYLCLLRCQKLDGFLKIAIFDPKKIKKGILTPSEELFINDMTGEYITRLLDDNYQEIRWSNRYIVSTDIFLQNWYYQHYAYVNNDAKYHIKKLGSEKDAFLNIYEYQKRERKKKQDIKEQRQLNEWDEDMNLVPEPPADIAEWRHRKLIDDHYIFYDKKGNTCYCTYCRKDMPLEKRHPAMKKIYKHNNKAKCYVCGKLAKMKNVNQLAGTTMTGTYHYQLISKLNDNSGIVIREFNIRLYYYKSDYRHPFQEINEYKRILYNGKSIKKYVYDLYKNSYFRWIGLTGDRYNFYSCSKLYKTNLRSLNKAIGKKSAILQYIRAGHNEIYKYIYLETLKPYLEKIVKAGLVELAEDVLSYGTYREGAEFNADETELVKILCIDKSRLARFKNMQRQDNISLMWLQEEKRKNTIYSDELIDEFSLANLIPSSFNFLKNKMTYQQIYNYIIKQTEPDDTMDQTYRTWADYMNMAEKIGMNTESEQVFKPKDLKASHDKCVKIMQQGEMKVTALKLEKEWPTANDVIKTLKKYEYRGEKYSVIAPDSIYDIVVEGTILGHCVHTCDYYFDRIQRQESYILFLRYSDRPDVPYYTLEVEPSGNIRQKRTTGDNQNKDFENAVNFLKEWQQVISQRLSDEDKKLGKKSDELRKKNYKELREKGNKVWHGKLAGKLLADVLEDDFMAAM